MAGSVCGDLCCVISLNYSKTLTRYDEVSGHSFYEGVDGGVESKPAARCEITQTLSC